MFNRFLKEYQTDEQFRIALIGYWLQRDHLASWRRLIRELDVHDHLEVADKIRHYAKEPSGMCKRLYCHSLVYDTHAHKIIDP